MKTIATALILFMMLLMVVGCVLVVVWNPWLAALMIAANVFGTWHGLDLIGYVWTGSFAE